MARLTKGQKKKRRALQEENLRRVRGERHKPQVMPLWLLSGDLEDRGIVKLK